MIKEAKKCILTGIFTTTAAKNGNPTIK